MESFAIEIYRPGVTDAAARELAAEVRAAIAAMADVGATVRYRGCTLLPGDEVCFIRVDAEGAANVDGVRRHMRLEDARVIRMIDVG